MNPFEYDYDDLARQVQSGLERIGVNFLLSHGARVRRDQVDFHGYEQIDLELTHDGRTLVIHQVGRPRLAGSVEPAPVVGVEEVFESTLDGWPASNTHPHVVARWLTSLPAGEAPPERSRAAADSTNPFARPSEPSRPEAGLQPAANPFLGERPRRVEANPFVDNDRERERQETLRRLRGDD